MDLEIMAGMVFSLVVLLMIGGFVLLLPLSQRLGKLLELWIDQHRSLKPGGGLDGEATQQMIAELSARLRALEEQQVFLEELVSKKGALPPPREEDG
ncbi:MAG TPA: hypothetical protein VLA09_14470 [Longimicrobiales bacterium]|nr:hypothetical protein [Longimicrobiales bacterium]